MIGVIVEQKRPAQGEKGQYGYVRQAEAKPKRGRRKRTKNQEFPGSDAEYGEHGVPMPMPIVYAIPMDSHYDTGAPHQLIHPSIPHGLPLPIPAPSLGTSMHAPGSGPLDAASVRNSPAEEEMDDGDEDPDFAGVRVGNAPPPSWGKRKASDEPEGESSHKKQKSRYGSTTDIDWISLLN